MTRLEMLSIAALVTGLALTIGGFTYAAVTGNWEAQGAPYLVAAVAGRSLLAAAIGLLLIDGALARRARKKGRS